MSTEDIAGPVVLVTEEVGSPAPSADFLAVKAAVQAALRDAEARGEIAPGALGTVKVAQTGDRQFAFEAQLSAPIREISINLGLNDLIPAPPDFDAPEGTIYLEGEGRVWMRVDGAWWLPQSWRERRRWLRIVRRNRRDAARALESGFSTRVPAWTLKARVARAQRDPGWAHPLPLPADDAPPPTRPCEAKSEAALRVAGLLARLEASSEVSLSQLRRLRDAQRRLARAPGSPPDIPF